MAKADLHIHSTASDGKMTPEQVVREAAGLKLSYIALTDHDTIKGVEKAREVARDYDIEVVPGVEITTAYGDRECHLLAYHFNMDDEAFAGLLALHRNARVQRARWIIGQLRNKGFELDIDEVLAEANGRNVGRPHIAEILRKKGYIASIREAFIRHLSDEALGPIENNYRDIFEVIDIVKQAGGVAVLAHPGRLYSNKELDAFANGGIDGIETIHPSHRYDIQKKMESFAENHGLLTTGGSDFHGRVKDYYPHFGLLTVPSAVVTKIETLAARRKEILA